MEKDNDLRMTDFSFDRAELVARGKIIEGNVSGSFLYWPFYSKVSIIVFINIMAVNMTC